MKKRLVLLAFTIFFLPSLASAAIAFDNGSGRNNGGATTTLKYSHTTGVGTDRILWMAVIGNNSAVDNITHVKYNGIPATQIGRRLNPDSGGTRWVYLYCLAAPSTGANTVEIKFAANQDFIGSFAASYTGAQQTCSGLASSTNATDGTFTATSITGTVTTVADNSWTVAAMANDTGNNTAQAGTTFRGTNTAFAQSLGDSNGAITPAGATSLGATFSASDAAIVIAAFAPAAEPAAATPAKSVYGSAYWW